MTSGRLEKKNRVAQSTMASPFSVHNLNPDLVRQVDEAYWRNAAEGRVVDDQYADGVAVKGLADVLHHGGTETEKKMNLTLSWEIKNQETLADFENAFHDTAVLFERVGERVPQPEDFESIGVDFSELAKKYEDMKDKWLDPQVVIAPHMDSFFVWLNLYDDLIVDEHLKWGTARREGETSLALPAAILNGWGELYDAYRSIPQLPKFRGEAENSTTVPNNLIDWSVRLIPAVRDMNHADRDYSAGGGVYPTVPEYLTLQALRIQDDKLPIDGAETVWLDGFANSNIAPIGYFQYGQRKICLDTVGKSYSSDARTIRQPQW